MESGERSSQRGGARARDGLLVNGIAIARSDENLLASLCSVTATSLPLSLCILVNGASRIKHDSFAK